MIPLALRIRSFRSFRKEQRIELPTEPGLYFMRGENEEEPRLDANGAGKSSVWDALHWCLFGETPRGLRAGDVCSWGEDGGTEVGLLLDPGNGEGPCELVRTWRPNSLRLVYGDAGEPEDLSTSKENPVLGWLGMGQQAFASSVLIAQGEPMFMDMKPGPQAELFSQALGLDRWLGYAEESGRRAATEAANLGHLRGRLGAAEARLGAIAQVDAWASHEAWERNRQERLEKLAQEHEQMCEHSGERADLDAAKEAEDKAFAAMREAAVDPKLKRDLARLRELLREAENGYAALEARLEDADDQLRRAERSEDCRACGQSLGSPAHLREARRRWDELSMRVEREGAALERAKADVALAEGALRERGARWEQLRNVAADASEDTRRARIALERHERELDRIEDEAEKLEGEGNPHAGIAERAEAERKRAKAEVRGLGRELAEAERRERLASYWARGFKEVRLALMAEALDELEAEANSSCEALGLSGWELRFGVDRETKGGTVARGFSQSVQAPGSPKAVPWRAWSGGEGQRLRLAGQAGLADLVRARSGSDFPLEVWDEPTAGLSDRGIQDLLEALATRALAEGRPVWVVDHRAHAFGGFAGGCRVVKAPSGSRIRMDGV